MKLGFQIKTIRGKTKIWSEIIICNVKSNGFCFAYTSLSKKLQLNHAGLSHDISAVIQTTQRRYTLCNLFK